MPRDNAQALHAPELLDADAAAALCGVSRRTWLSLDSKNEIPKAVQLPIKRLTRWRRGDVLKWIEELPTRQT